MSTAGSVDLRECVIHAVETSASRHQAAERFEASLAAPAASADSSRGSAMSRLEPRPSELGRLGSWDVEG